IAPAVRLPVTPVAVWIVANRSLTLSAMPMLVPDEVVPATKLKTVPFTTSVSPVVMPEVRSLEEVPAAPDSLVALLIVAELSLLTTEPVTLDEVADRRFVAVSPGRGFEVTVDLVALTVGACRTWLATRRACAVR